jgi:hypothetical protein
MSPREGFGIVVRAVGLGLIIHGVGRATAALAIHQWSIHLWFHTLLTIGIGIWMLRGARPLVNWAYTGET